MKLNLAQTKLIELTMKLDLKSREYKLLCNKLEKYKKSQIDENDEKLYQLLNEFQKNYYEIAEIKKQLYEIEKIRELKQESHDEKFSYEYVFKSKKKNKTDESDYKNEKMIVRYQESLWKRIKKKIRKIFRFY